MASYLGSKPVFVAGGGIGVGLEIVKLLSALGTPVRALVRSVFSTRFFKVLSNNLNFAGVLMQRNCLINYLVLMPLWAMLLMKVMYNQL